MMTTNMNMITETIAAVQALGELLQSKGLVEPEAFDEARSRAREMLNTVARPRVRLLQNMGDKYEEEKAVDIDCAARLHLCQARCCQLVFPLTPQDLDEGIARWDYGNPYWIKRRDDGYCIHNDPETHFCMIHPQRPHVCRLFDCRKDPRIWIDFDQRIPAPIEALNPGDSIGRMDMNLVTMLNEKDAEGASANDGS
jgi:Fe-S-cluster containining protein